MLFNDLFTKIKYSTIIHIKITGLCMWNPFKSTKNIIEVEKKSFTMPAGWYINGTTGSNNQISIKRALRFYDEAAPVATAIDWINDEFKTLSLLLKEGDEIINDSEILKFLQRPNDDMTQEDFLEHIGAYFLITNEVYIIATGNVNREPAELLIVSPEYVAVKKDKDGFIGQINVQRTGLGTEVFKRADNAFRFYNKDQSAEIWQIKGFSVFSDNLYSQSDDVGSSLTSSRGRSKLSSICREINQYIEIGTHNLSSLDNGVLPSGTITVPEGTTLDDDQFERVREQIVQFYSGAKNSGKVLILDNGMTFTPLGTNAKDMDFKELTKTVTITIFNRYKVPLPLISPDNMTLANMESAKLGLYDNAVIPLAQRLLRELTNFLAPRFGLSEDALIIADLGKIAALQLRRNQELKLKKELNIYTTNQLRFEAGLEEEEGGDVIYIPNNLVPMGSEVVRQGNEIIDVTPPQKQLADMTTRKEFIAVMKKQIDSKGNCNFTDSEIEEIADGEGL